MNAGKFSLLFVGSFILINSSFSQKAISEATINYEIITQSIADKDAAVHALPAATLTITLKGTQSKAEMNSALGTETNFFDSKSGKGTILKQYSGQKLMISLSKDNWLQKNQFYQNMKFTIDNTETTIAGLKCKKATGQTPDGKALVIYFAPSVLLQNKEYDNSFTQLPGLPVQYELESGKLKFKYSLNNISYEPVASTVFDLPKTGFRLLTYEETQQLRKGEK